MSLLDRLHTRHQLRKKKQITLVKSHHTKEYTRENTIKAKEKEEASITLPDAVFFVEINTTQINEVFCLQQ